MLICAIHDKLQTNMSPEHFDPFLSLSIVTSQHHPQFSIQQMNDDDGDYYLEQLSTQPVNVPVPDMPCRTESGATNGNDLYNNNRQAGTEDEEGPEFADPNIAIQPIGKRNSDDN